MNIVALIAALVAAPLMPGIVNKVKALFAGRRGPGLFRLYFDIAKLMRKSCPRSATSTWIFDVAPAVGLASTGVAAAIFPWTASGDAGLFTTASAVTFFYLMGLGRFFTVLGRSRNGKAALFPVYSFSYGFPDFFFVIHQYHFVQIHNLSLPDY